MNKKMRAMIAGGIFVGICILAAQTSPSGAGGVEPGPWFSIVPPMLAITLAIVTQRLVFSLASGILVGGLLTTLKGQSCEYCSWWKGLFTGGQYVFGAATDGENLTILAFVLFILTMVMVMIASGGMEALVGKIAKYAKGPRSAQIMTGAMGLAVFIDDYANTMIVGSAMRPLTDKYNVSREKLAFLVDATAAPIAGLAVVSTWAGYQLSQAQAVAKTLGVEGVGYGLVLEAIPYRFYCIFMIAFVAAVVFLGRDFGPMYRAERRASKTGKVSADDAEMTLAEDIGDAKPMKGAQGKGRSAAVPLVVLFALLFGGMWTDGGGWAQMGQSFFAFLSPAVWREVISASENGTKLLASGAFAGLLFAVGFGLFVGKLKGKQMGEALWLGLRAGFIPLLILVLSWALKSACDGLHLKDYLLAVVGPYLSDLWLPFVLFILAGITAFSTGSSWGTMAILIPAALPIAVHFDGGAFGMLTVMSLASILDGAIFGDHCSPISDTTIMSSIASSCDHMHHVRTQMPYALIVASVALFAGYFPAARGVPAWLALLVGVGILWGGVRYFGKEVELKVNKR